MSEIKDGGPAFPCEIPLTANERAAGCHPSFKVGLSMRDYFAAKALVGLFAMEANPRVGQAVEPFRSDKPEHVDAMARISYELADAMLRARGKS